MKKHLSLLTALLMLVSIFTGCSGSTSVSEVATPVQSGAISDTAESTSPDELLEFESTTADDLENSDLVESTPEKEPSTVNLPLTKEQESFTWWLKNSISATNSMLDNKAYQELLARTNVAIDFICPTTGGEAEDMNLMVASGDYADLMSGFAAYYSGGIASGLENDVIIELNGLVDDYMPNYKAVLESSEDINKQSRTDDGVIWGVHCISTTQQDPFLGLMIRQDWLDEFDLDMPQTYDELEQVLSVFKQKCPMGALLLGASGACNMSYSLTAGFDCSFLSSPFINLDGTVVYTPATDNMREYVRLMNDWYKNGLIYSDFFSIGFMQDEELYVNGTVGVFDAMYVAIDNVQPTDPNYQMAAMPNPRQSEGDQLHLVQTTWQVRTEESACISTTCENPELLCKYLDYMWSDEGVLLVNYGIEGDTYTIQEDGTARFVDSMYITSDGSTFNDNLSATAFVNCPIYYHWERELVTCSDAALAASDVWTANADNAYVMPSVSLTTEEAEKLSSIQNDLNTLASEKILQFIIGDADINAEWDSFVANLTEMGYQDAEAMYQDALDRYNSR